MPVAFDNATTEVIGTNTTWAVTKPAFVSDGDLILVFLVHDTDGVVNTIPTGWTQVGTSQTAAADSMGHLYWKNASSEPASWSWIFAVGETGSAAVLTYTGQHATLPIGTTVNVDFRQAADAASPFTAGSITPPVNDCMLVAFYGSDPVAGQAMTPDSSPAATERLDVINGTISWIGVQEFLQGTAAAVTLEGTMVNADTYVCFVVAVRPAVAAVALPSLVMAPPRAG